MLAIFGSPCDSIAATLGCYQQQCKTHTWASSSSSSSPLSSSSSQLASSSPQSIPSSRSAAQTSDVIIPGMLEILQSIVATDGNVITTQVTCKGSYAYALVEARNSRISHQQVTANETKKVASRHISTKDDDRGTRQTKHAIVFQTHVCNKLRYTCTQKMPMQTSVCLHSKTHMHAPIHMHTQTHTHTRTCMYVRMYVCMYACMYVCMYVRMYA